MYVVEWVYGLNATLNSKVCEGAEQVRFWVELAKSQGASLIVVSPCGHA